MRRELGVRRERASRGVRAADRFSLRPTHTVFGVARAGTRGARRERSRRFSIRGRFGEARVRSARPQHMAPTVNDVSSPRFFTPLPFASGAAGPSGAAGATRDDHHPHGHAVAHGVKRDASQMMTVEERDERVRKIVSLVKVLLTGACGRDIARVSTRDARPSPIAQAAALGPRTVAFDRHAFPIAKKLRRDQLRSTFFFSSESPNQPAADGSDERPDVSRT